MCNVHVCENILTVCLIYSRDNIAFLDIFLEHLTVMRVVQNRDDSFNAFICKCGLICLGEDLHLGSLVA